MKVPTHLSTLAHTPAFFTDLFCSFIPIVILRELQIQKRTKIIICLVTGLEVMYVSLLTLQNLSIDAQPYHRMFNHTNRDNRIRHQRHHLGVLPLLNLRNLTGQMTRSGDFGSCRNL